MRPVTKAVAFTALIAVQCFLVTALDVAENSENPPQEGANERQQPQARPVAPPNGQGVRQPGPPPQSPARQRPQPGLGGLLSGLLGTLTKTADASECPGKCIHAIASLICDSVLEEVQCPSPSMRCCVEREGRPPKRPSKPNRPQTTTAATTTTKKRTTPARTTPRPTTRRPVTTKKATTTRSVEKFDDGDVDLDLISSSSSSTPASRSSSLSFHLSVLLTSVTLTLTSGTAWVASSFFGYHPSPSSVSFL